MWFFKSKEERHRERYDNGYSWAARQLLQGTPIRDVQSHSECAEHFGDYDAFDMGADAAVDRFKSLLPGTVRRRTYYDWSNDRNMGK